MYISPKGLRPIILGWVKELRTIPSGNSLFWVQTLTSRFIIETISIDTVTLIFQCYPYPTTNIVPKTKKRDFCI